MNQPSPAIEGSNPSALTQSRVRDARLFLGLAYVPCLLVCSSALFSSAGITGGWGLGYEGVAVAVVALCSWTTLLLIAVWKLLGAQRAGVTLCSSSLVEILLGLNAALLVSMWLGTEFLAPFITTGWSRPLIALPALCLAVPLARRLVARGEQKFTPQARALFVLMLAQLWLAYGLTCACLSENGLRAFFDSGWDEGFGPARYTLFTEKDADRGLYFPPTTEFRCLVWLLPWSLASAVTCCRLTVWLRNSGRRKTAICLALAAAFFTCLLLMLLANLLPFTPTASRFALLIAIPALVLGTALGLVLAWKWKGDRATWRHRAVTVAPCVILLCALTIPVGGIAAQALFFCRPSEVKQSWVWHLPEWVRRPVTSTIVWLWPRGEDCLLDWGLLPADVARGIALTRNMYHDAWIAWGERDPEAMRVALAIPETNAPTQLTTPYDFGAGYLIGRKGDETAIRDRLTGSYSEHFINGLALGLMGERRSSQYADAMVARFERFTIPSNAYGIYRSLKRAPEQVKPHLRRYVGNPNAMNLLRLRCLTGAWANADPDFSFAEEVLQSDNVELRKIAFLSIYWSTHLPKTMSLIRPFLASLDGNTPNTDADEQRLAVQCASRCFGWGVFRGRRNLATASGVPVAPLTQQESGEIKECIEHMKKLEAEAGNRSAH